jgi:hypothetical protein
MQVDGIDAAISEIDREVDADVESFHTAITMLTTFPRVSDLSARVIMAEIKRGSCNCCRCFSSILKTGPAQLGGFPRGGRSLRSAHRAVAEGDGLRGE